MIAKKNTNNNISKKPLSHAMLKRSPLYTNRKRRHRPASCDFKGSFTVEAAVVLPIFIFITVFLLIYFRILAVSWGIGVSLQDVSRNSAIFGEGIGISQPDKDRSPKEIDHGQTAVLIGAAQAAFRKNQVMGKFIEGGLLGINMMASRVDGREIDLVAAYKVKIPINFFGQKYYGIIQRARTKKWVGYDPKEGEEDKEKVYVTKTGTAYHSRVDCVYLSPSISATTRDEVGSKRNESGGKYYPCEKCGNNGGSMLYITDYGTVYHTTITCSTLSRNIRKLEKERAVSSGYHACPKCGG